MWSLRDSVSPRRRGCCKVKTTRWTRPLLFHVFCCLSHILSICHCVQCSLTSIECFHSMSIYLHLHLNSNIPLFASNQSLSLNPERSNSSLKSLPSVLIKSLSHASPLSHLSTLTPLYSHTSLLSHLSTLTTLYSHPSLLTPIYSHLSTQDAVQSGLGQLSRQFFQSIPHTEGFFEKQNDDRL